MSNWYKQSGEYYVKKVFEPKVQKGEYPKWMIDWGWDFVGINLETGEERRYRESEEEKEERKKNRQNDCGCSHSMDMHCDGGDDGW